MNDNYGKPTPMVTDPRSLQALQALQAMDGLLAGAHHLPEVKKQKPREGVNPLEKKPRENRRQFRARKHGYKKPLTAQECRELTLLERQKRTDGLSPTKLWRLAELRLRGKR